MLAEVGEQGVKSVMIALSCIEECSVILSRCEEEPINIAVLLILVIRRNIQN